MAKQPIKIGPDPLLAKPFYLLTADDFDAYALWRQQVVEATMTPARLREIEDEKRAAAEARREQALNAWPILEPGTPVRAEIRGWQSPGCCVLEDAGPASDGARKIMIEKVTREQRIAVRRDRVRAVTA